MSKFVVLCLLVLCISASLISVDARSPNRPLCPKRNQAWTDCGSACPPRCNQPLSQICTLQCIIGCQCKPGYLLNKNGECVKPEDC